MERGGATASTKALPMSMSNEVQRKVRKHLWPSHRPSEQRILIASPACATARAATTRLGIAAAVVYNPEPRNVHSHAAATRSEFYLRGAWRQVTFCLLNMARYIPTTAARLTMQK